MVYITYKDFTLAMKYNNLCYCSWEQHQLLSHWNK